MSKKVDVVKAVNKLPYEAILQIENTLEDDDLKLEDVSIQYIIEDVKWSVERINMVLGHMDGEVYNEAIRDKNKLLNWLKYYSKYEEINELI